MAKPSTRAKHSGISRIDQPERRTHGWYVRAQINGKSHAKFFSDAAHGSKQKALENAIVLRDVLAAKKAAAPARKRDTRATKKVSAASAPRARKPKAVRAGAGKPSAAKADQGSSTLQDAAAALRGLFSRLRPNT